MLRGIFTGEGIFCTICGVLLLYFLCQMLPQYSIVFIILFILWELYVNTFYTAKIKHNEYINSRLNSLRYNMNSAKERSTYNRYKNEYESIKRSETARKVGEVIGALGTTAIIQGAIDKHMDKEKEKMKQLISKAEQAEKNVEDYMKERWG